MKIILERDAFSTALSAAMRAAERADAIPILSNIVLRPNGSTMGIAGTNLSMQVETSVPADIQRGSESESNITVKADILAGIVSRLPTGAQVSLEWDDPTAGATLKSGRAKYKFWTLPAADFPSLAAPEMPAKFSMPGKLLADILHRTKFAVLKGDRTRPYLTGLSIQVGTNEHAAFGGTNVRQLEFVSCDARQLARLAIDIPPGAENLSPVILPEFGMTEVARLASEAADVDIEIASNTASFTAKSATFTTKLIDGTFPEYRRVVPANNAKQVTVDVEELSHALQRVRLVGDDARARAKITPSQIHLSMIDAKRGEADEIISVEYDGPEISIGVNAGAVLSILDSIDTDLCRLDFDTPDLPILAYPIRGGAVDYARLFLTMPCR